MGSNSMFTGRAPGAKITLEPDWFVLNDGAAAEVPPLLRDGPRVPPEKVKVFIDHETPCGSEAVCEFILISEHPARVKFTKPKR